MIINNRPVFLNLIQFRFPIAAIMSVGHRASGVVMVLCIPLLLYLLEFSLRGPQGFSQALDLVQSNLGRLLLLVILWALLHHLLAGIRYLFIDFDMGVGKKSGRLSAIAVMLAAPILAIVIGFLL